MLKVLTMILFIYLFVKCIKLVFKLAWGTVKILAAILLAIALPALVLSLVFASGVVLLVPIALIAGAFGLLKICT